MTGCFGIVNDENVGCSVLCSIWCLSLCIIAGGKPFCWEICRIVAHVEH